MAYSWPTLSPKAEKRVITLGQTGILSGPMLSYQRSINNGIVACIRQINAEGGIGGYKLAFRCHDNKNNPVQALKDMESLKSDGVDLIIGATGARNIKALLPSVKSKEVAMLFPWGVHLNDATQRLSYMIHGGTTLKTQLKSLVHHLAGDLHHTKIGIVHSDSEFNRANAELATRLLKAYKIDPVISCSYNSKTLDIQDALEQLNKSKPRSIIFLATSKPTSKFVKNILNHGCYVTDFVGTDATVFVPQLLQESSKSFAFSSTVPSIQNVDYPIVQEYLTASRKFLPQEHVNELALTYFINTKILAQALKTIIAQEKPVNRETVVSALERIRDMDIGGFIADFDRNARTVYPLHVSIVKG